MISILFVDDEANMRANLQRMLRSRRDRWSMRFAGSGTEALTMLQAEAADVVVSDMEMPGMSGAELLARIRHDFPETILIILSGQCDRRTALRIVDPAHVYLPKPCDCAELINTVERAHRLRTLLIEPHRGQAYVEGDGPFKESPVHADLARMFRDPDLSVETVADMIVRDEGLSKKILRLVNGAFFGASQRVLDIKQAIRLLGLDLFRSLVLDMARSVSVDRRGRSSPESPISGHAFETGIVMVTADEEARIRLVNDAYRRSSGGRSDEMIGRSYPVLSGPGATPQLLTLATRGQDVRTTVLQHSPDRWFDLSVTPLLDGAGRMVYHLCTEIEIPVTAGAPGNTNRSAPAIAFDQLGNGLLVLDHEGSIIAVNRGFEIIFGYSPAEVVGRSLRFFSSPLHGREFHAERERTIREAGYWRGEVWHRLRNGLSIPHFVTITMLDDGSLATPHYIAEFRTTLKKRDLERLRFLSNRDVLSGLANRTLFGEEVAIAVQRARLSDRRLTVLAIHLDRFKLLNDSLGANAGDELIREQAARLTDYAGERGLAAGSARGEFLLLIEDLDRDDEAQNIANQVARILSRSVKIDGNEVSVDVSIGFSCFPGDGEDAAQLMGNAEAALLEPGEGGSRSSRRFAREMSMRSVARFTIGNRLRAAIGHDQLALHYQPKISSITGAITGLEALLRWHHPQEGFVAPTRFIPVAEEIGLIEAIGDWVLETACMQMREWQIAGIAPDRMAINLSPHQFQQPELLSRVKTVLHQTGLDPRFVEAEITESSTMGDPEAAIRLMSALRDIGITLAIDDFGTGYSSLTYLKRFPINSLKIDQSFVRGLPHDANDGAICEAIIALARTLRLGLVAEGVETAEQQAFLIERGCTEMQGYLFSRPRCAAEIETLLRSGSLSASNGGSAIEVERRIPIGVIT